jgi:transcriptional regulator with XRE-family HTH domain
MNIAPNIKRLRLAAGLSVTEAANRAGMAQAAWSRIETGRHSPTVATLAKIAEALGVTVEALVQIKPSAPKV